MYAIPVAAANPLNSCQSFLAKFFYVCKIVESSSGSL